MPAHTCESGAHFVKAHGTKNAFCFCAAQPQSAATLAIFQLYYNTHIWDLTRNEKPRAVIAFSAQYGAGFVSLTMACSAI
jgi:hypothetical protein